MPAANKSPSFRADFLHVLRQVAIIWSVSVVFLLWLRYTDRGQWAPAEGWGFWAAEQAVTFVFLVLGLFVFRRYKFLGSRSNKNKGQPGS